VVILSSKLMALSPTARCCALKDLDKGLVRGGGIDTTPTPSGSRCGATNSLGIRNAVFALFEPVLEVSGRGVREPDVVVQRPEERYAGADQDGNPGDG
jgi:hypothetical protein